MKKQFINFLSVAVFAIGIGWFGNLMHDWYRQTHMYTRLPGPSIGEMRENSPRNEPETNESSSDATSSPAYAGDRMVVWYPSDYGLPEYSKTNVGSAITMFPIGTDANDRPLKAVYTLTGSAPPNAAKIVVTYTPELGAARDADTYALKSFKAGDANWKYSFGANLGNLKDGLNEYVARAYDAAGKQIAETTVVASLNAGSYPDDGKDFTTLDVAWHEPVKTNVLDVFGKAGETDRYVHAYGLLGTYWSQFGCMMGPEVVESETAPTEADSRGKMAAEAVYDVGTVKGGSYDGATVYVHDAPADICGRPDHRDTMLKHFLQATDGSLMSLDEPAYDVSLVTDPMPWDGESIVDGSGPDHVSIDNSGVKLVACEAGYCKIGKLQQTANASAAPGFSRSETPVYAGEEGCFEVKRADGFLQDYRVDIDPTITWLDGKTSTTTYTPDPVTGGCGYQPRHCHWIFQGDPSTLERVGTTKQGLEVYQEKVSPAQLAAMGSGTMAYKSGIQSLYELFWSMAKYGENENITPAQFVARHPAVYVKDPLGRLVYFQGEQFGPAVECGKPVIYLYPEQTTDVSVKVAPTGGFTVTDPPYGDGWSVRATPESELFNYDDGKTYPYLFWEGHGDEYTRPTKGFVASRAEVPALLKEKLALLGLNDKESADFMEFWEPRLTAKPYVFVTFVDQPTFDTIAPLTVEPTPDTVIRVFMDYEPLDAPIAVDPLPIVTPKRTGFSVVEWGGALHPGDRGMCAAGALLQ